LCDWDQDLPERIEFLLVSHGVPGQVIAAAMPDKNDPAAVFACAMSLHDACMECAGKDPSVDISAAYRGGGEFLRQMMRVGNLFETWACGHVDFEKLTDGWPYLLQDRFGAVCIEVMDAGSFGQFDSNDCLRVAFKLRLPMRVDGLLPLPVCVEALNPFTEAEFQRLRIQTVRQELDESDEIAPFTEDDDPFDENYGPPIFGIYGVRGDDCLEHIADRESYHQARALLISLIPGIDMPEEMVAFVKPDTRRDAAAGP
jgi:hypothetical protein